MAAFQIFQPTDIEIGQHCGISNTSSVSRAKVIRTGVVVAVKNVTHIGLQQRELDILKRLRHDNIVRLLGTIDREGVVMMELVLEYAPNGNLYEFLNEATEFLPYLPWCKQAVCAVAYIHEQNISHRDIKSKNYLVFFEDVIKLTDFGMSKIANDITRTTQNLGGTLLWMSPEVMDENDRVDHFKSDIYSLGIVLWELYHQKKPYNEWKLKQIIRHVVTYKDHLEIEDDCDIRELLLSCWEYEPTQRPTADEILTSLNNNKGTSIDRKNRNSRRRRPSRSDMAVYGYWLILAFVAILLGLVTHSFIPNRMADIITSPTLDIKPEIIPTTQPEIIPTTQPAPQPAGHPTTQPTTVVPTTTAAPRDWQKEGHRQINDQKRKDNKRGTVRVYDRDFRYHASMEWFKYYSTATDVATEIKADAGGYESRGGANEHAIENLINKLMAKKII